MACRHRHLGGGVLILAAIHAALAACPETEPALEAVQSALLEARIDDAQEAIEVAGSSLLCGEQVQRKALSRYWLLRGAVEHFAGRPKPAANAFVAAYRTDPTVKIEDFGKAFDEAVELAVLEAPHTFGRVKLDPARVDAEVWVNGAERALPSELDTGLYAVQLVDRERVVFAQLVDLLPGTEVVLETGLPPVTALASKPTVVSRERRPPPVLLAAAAVAGGLALGSGALYLRENGAMNKATSQGQLLAARDRQIGFSVAGIGFGAVGLIAVGGHFALKPPRTPMASR